MTKIIFMGLTNELGYRIVPTKEALGILRTIKDSTTFMYDNNEFSYVSSGFTVPTSKASYCELVIYGEVVTAWK